MTGNRRDLVDGAGWEMLFVAIDDHARIAFTAVHSDEKKREAVALLHNAVAYYAVLGVCVKRLLTDNDAAFRPRSLRLPARPWACSTSSQGRTGHRPMARPRGLSSLRCASGPMGERTRTQRSGPMPWRAGSTTTTGTGRAAASAISLRCPGSNLQITS